MILETRLPVCLECGTVLHIKMPEKMEGNPCPDLECSGSIKIRKFSMEEA